MGSPSIVSFTHKFSSNFEPKKYDFNICKRFFMEKMTQINQISKKKKKPNQQFLVISSIDLAKNIEGFFFKKLYSHL
jgi:hypothetical protein